MLSRSVFEFKCLINSVNPTSMTYSWYKPINLPIIEFGDSLTNKWQLQSIYNFFFHKILWAFKKKKKKKKRKHHFSPYILELRSIWSLYFSSIQFGPCYFQLVVNLVSTVNSLTENAYVANDLSYWCTCG